MFDLIVSGGLVVDGSGTPGIAADIGIRDERIAAIGDLAQADAQAHIKADGMVVTPGFIDAHSHSDTYLLLEPDAPSKLSQGITTEINGQCGGGAVPIIGAARIPSDWASFAYPTPANPQTVAVTPGPTWSSVASYRHLFEAVRPALNTVQFIGHNILRAGVMGYAPRAATQSEIATMVRNLEQALDEGGWGLSSGLIYQPGRYAQYRELLALATAAVRSGGMYATHMRSEGDQLLESVSEVLQLAEESGIRVQFSHLKTAGHANWHKIGELIGLLEKARAQGVELHADRYPYLSSATELDIVLPEWAVAGGNQVIMANLQNPEKRRRIEQELDQSEREWERITIGGGWSDLTRSFSGHSVQAAATALKRTPGETICLMISSDQARTSGFFAGMCRENLRQIYALPWVMPGSDASLRAPWGVLGRDHPHPRAYGTMPRYLRLMLGRLEEGDVPLCSLEEAVRRMSGLPAAAYGIAGRGVLRPGNYADLVVLDLEKLCDTATYGKPHSFSQGIAQVVVNGVVSYAEGRFTNQRNGHFLER